MNHYIKITRIGQHSILFPNVSIYGNKRDENQFHMYLQKWTQVRLRQCKTLPEPEALDDSDIPEWSLEQVWHSSEQRELHRRTVKKGGDNLASVII